MSQELLVMKNITKKFPGVVALDNVTFSCEPGKVHALMGENGAGKSTLIKLLSGASNPTSGEIYFNDKPFKPVSPMDAMKKGIAIIYQEINLIPNLNAYENIYLGREKVKGITNDFKQMKKDAAQILEGLNVKIDLDKHVRKLSVAEQQMVEIAKALSMDASLIVMDEPTSSLTNTEIDALYKTIRQLKSQGVTIIYISHHLDEVFEISDDVTVLKDGVKVGTYPTGELNHDKLISLMVGRDLSEIYPPKAKNIGKKVLEVNGLSKKGKIKDVSFVLHEGEILGIAGLMGAGRTELVQALFGVYKTDCGEIKINEKACQITSPKRAMRNGLGYLTEDRKNEGLVLGMTVRNNMSLGVLQSICKAGIINGRKEKKIINGYVQNLRIKTPSIEAKAVNLSGGNQQKVVLGKWLACNSNIIILDEPTRGIDVGAKMEIYNLMRNLANEGRGIIMISSELPEILGMSDRVLVMRQGKLVGEITKEDATEERILSYAMGGNKK